MKNKSIISKSILSATLLFSMANVHADNTGYNQISFSTEVETQTENDEISASLYIKEQSTDPKVLANQLNNKLNQAMAIASKYPSVEVSTSRQNTYPQYKHNQIVGWTGETGVQLHSTDIVKASELIAELQNIMVINGVSFGVSKDKQKQLEEQLLSEVSSAFQEKANQLVSQWHASGYRLVELNINNNGSYSPPMMMRESVMLDSASGSVATTPNFKSGSSDISLNMNGTIELISPH